MRRLSQPRATTFGLAATLFAGGAVLLALATHAGAGKVLALLALAGLAAALGLFARGKRSASLIPVLLAGACLLLAAADAGLALIGGPAARDEWSGALAEPDALLGTGLRANAAARHIRRPLTSGYDVEWDVTYHTEGDHSRAVPGRPATGARIALFGGSFMFGEGLEDDETIGARLQARLGDARVFNLAVRGHGTAQNYLALVRDADEHRDTAARVIGFIPDHVRRTAMPYSLIASDWARLHPRVVLREGRVVDLGPALDALGPVGRLHVGLLHRWRLYRRLFGGSTIGPDDWALVAGLMRAAGTACAERDGSVVLVVVLPTGVEQREPATLGTDYRSWRNDLIRSGVRLDDLNDAFDARVAETGEPRASWFYSDGHPRARYADWVAERIAAELVASDAFSASTPAGSQ